MTTTCSPLRHLDVINVDANARIEARNREVRLPAVSVYRWWARRTEAVNGAILDAVSEDRPGRLLVSDPFAGGGVIPLAAVVRGHRVYAQEFDPWASMGLHAMLTLPQPGTLTEGLEKLEVEVSEFLAQAYGTTLDDGSEGWISHTFRVASAECSSCGYRQRLFPHAMVSLLERKERGKPGAFLACPKGHVFGASQTTEAECPTCETITDPKVVYTSGRTVRCPSCQTSEKLHHRAGHGSWRWEVVLVERTRGTTRELALPRDEELSQADSERWKPTLDLGPIPEGQETAVLRRHGFENWSDLYPRRQRAVIEALLDAVNASILDENIGETLRMAILGTVEMAGHASRWDRWYLKSYETMASHRFNFTTLAAEPNVWGTKASGRGTLIRRVRLLERAADWFREHVGHLEVEGPLPANARRHDLKSSTDVRIVTGSSERQLLPASTADLILTDPPYHDDVQYSELSLPLRSWAGMTTHRQEGEAVANAATGSNTSYEAYRELLQKIFAESRRTLVGNGHLIFSYANRDPQAWAAVFEALQGAGFYACGWAVVHSENETDHAKRNVRACTMDFLMDLVPSEPAELWNPDSLPTTPEGEFLGLVGEGFAKVGNSGTWDEEYVDRLRATRFLGG